jgi:hypothetical protein
LIGTVSVEYAVPEVLGLGHVPRQCEGGKLGPGYQIPSGEPNATPTDTGGQSAPEDEMLGQIMRELEKAVREGRLKPVVVGPLRSTFPDKQAPPDPDNRTRSEETSLGQILRDILSAGGSGQAQVPRQEQALALIGGADAAVFGDRRSAFASWLNALPSHTFLTR